MTDLQVLLDAHGTGPQELSTAAATLLASVPGVELVRATAGQADLLAGRFGGRVLPTDLRTAPVRREVPVLVASGRAAYARGAVRRVLADLATPGRLLTCVLVPGDDVGQRLACWSPEWLGGYAGTLEDLVGADLDFDRRHLPAGSPVARAWLRADAVGLARAQDVAEDPAGWARTTGLRLERDAAVAAVRAPLGAARRRASRWRQRRGRSARVR